MNWIAIEIFVAGLVFVSLIYFLLPLLKKERDDLLKKPLTAYRELDESKYKAEQELADRYRSFVTEILRLSLAGIAVFGFLYKEIFQCSQERNVEIAQHLAALGVIMFAASAMYALVFIYAASEGYRYYIVGLRYFDQDNPSGTDISSAESYLTIRREKIDVCRNSKACSSLALGFGGMFMAASICIILSKS
jgi:hypothetical protein